MAKKKEKTAAELQAEKEEEFRRGETGKSTRRNEQAWYKMIEKDIESQSPGENEEGKKKNGKKKNTQKRSARQVKTEYVHKAISKLLDKGVNYDAAVAKALALWKKKKGSKKALSAKEAKAMGKSYMDKLLEIERKKKK